MLTPTSHISFVLMASFATSQNYDWLSRPTLSEPSHRAAPAMAFEPLLGKHIYFGGYDSALLQDTWEWDGTSWTPLPLSVQPAPRMHHTMTYFGASSTVVLFGGDSGANVLSDTWSWNGSQWNILQPQASPSPRAGHATCYDSARNRLVLFGGYNCCPPNRLGDTWEWDGASWLPASPVNTPVARALHAMAYDAARQTTVMFGGDALQSPYYLADTWTYDGSDWLQQAPGPQSARYGHAMVYDSSRSLVVMFGGRDAASSLSYLQDTWTWDGTGWSPATTSYMPTPRRYHAMSFDSGRGSVVVHGGDDASGWIGTLGTWEARNWSPSATPYSSGCGNPALQALPTPGSAPSIGSQVVTQIANTNNNIAFLAWGFSRTHAGPFPLPFPMDLYGLAGCWLLQDCSGSSALAAQPNGANSAQHIFSIPNSTQLVGLTIYTQAWASRPGANPAGIVVSNGVAMTIGL
jgi:hypothetical protein